MDLDPRTDLSFTRILAVPRPLIWACWTQAQHIPHFFIPAPHKVTACDIDLRVGGRFNTQFDVGGTVMDNKGVYLDVVAQEKLVFTDAYTEGWKPAPEPFMTATSLLTDTDAGQTRYTAIARHRTPEARQTHEEMGCYDGSSQGATRLEAYAKTLD